MTKETKKNTTRKATAAKKVVAKKTNRKEETMMKVNINDTLEKIRYNMINSNIININKKYHKALPTYTMEEIYAYINQSKNPEEIIKALTIITVMKEKLVTKAYNEYKLNRSYGREDIHPSELNKDSELTIKEQKALLRKQLRELDKIEKEQA